MKNNIGIYIHVPFCKSKCPYCDFYSIPTEESVMDNYVTRLIDEINQWSEKIKKEVDTIYFGGGTPSLLGNSRLNKIMEALYDKFNVKEPEVTLEVNPTSSNELDFKGLLNNNINRLSIGLQTANNNELKILGRQHSCLDAKNTVLSAQDAGFRNISLDLMLAIPEQNQSSLKHSIDFCKELNVQHISSYLLKIEKGTPFFVNKDKLNLKDDDTQSDLYLYACNQLESEGFFQYEISNFSKPGKESRHNLKYWNCEEYLGLGPGAHSFIDNKRFYYKPSLKNFLYTPSIIDNGLGGDIEEYCMLKLRLNQGLNNEEFKSRFNMDIPENFLENAKKYEKYGLLKIENKTIKFTKAGFLVSNELICKIIL